ncbi:hypothetical protein B1A_08231 [mine drainage metagenome]|uniref:Type I-U CRISPR-associated protein Cas5/Cas6 n=1 Tax=mine drainage metagenome TaxID=410659 RepID=T1B031_9ZZZZ
MGGSVMLIISVEFLTGRFHANPWGRNVNEGVTEWPPSPYRIIRAVIDSWKRKCSDLDASRVEHLLELLSSAQPKFYLPSAQESYIKVYMSQVSTSIYDRQLVYDAFVVTNPSDKILLGWDDISLEPDDRKDLNQLLSRINYLGRSESWVRMKLHDSAEATKWNCFPVWSGSVVNDMHTLEVGTTMPKQEYVIRQKDSPKNLGWFDALAYSTKDILERNDSSPPAFKQHTYAISDTCFSVDRHPLTKQSNKKITSVLLGLESKILPLATETVVISERIHRKLLGIDKRISGEYSKVSSKFSGRDSEGKRLTGHRHIYIIPWDSNNDGRIDHVLITGKDEFNHSEIQSLNALTSIWQSGGKPDIKLVPIQWGMIEEISANFKTTKFKSETPFLPTRHYRKGRGIFDQWLEQEVKHECKNHGYPEPVSVRRLDKLDKAGHSFHWIEFVRSRKGDQVASGYGFEIVFSEPIFAPFAIGYGAHFGLGTFLPTKA